MLICLLLHIHDFSFHVKDLAGDLKSNVEDIEKVARGLQLKVDNGVISLKMWALPLSLVLKMFSLNVLFFIT